MKKRVPVIVRMPTPELQRLFDAMRDTEMALTDFDLATASPRYEKAMDAARRFNDALAKHEGLL